MRIKRTAIASLITCGLAFFAGASATADEDQSRIAETMLLYQRDSGGWPKNYDADARLDEDAKAKILAEKHRNDATFDNGATHREVRFLSQAYARTGDNRFKRAALRGIEFMLDAQYPNGGWPQRYPEPRRLCETHHVQRRGDDRRDDRPSGCRGRQVSLRLCRRRNADAGR